METNLFWQYLAQFSALITIFFGITCFIAPKFSFKLLRIQTTPDHPDALAESRATMAGFYLGVGVLTIIMPSNTLFLALGCSWLATASGRFVSIFADKGSNKFNWVSVTIEAFLGLFALAPVVLN